MEAGTKSVCGFSSTSGWRRVREYTITPQSPRFTPGMAVSSRMSAARRRSGGWGRVCAAGDGGEGSVAAWRACPELTTAALAATTINPRRQPSVSSIKISL